MARIYCYFKWFKKIEVCFVFRTFKWTRYLLIRHIIINNTFKQPIVKNKTIFTVTRTSSSQRIRLNEDINLKQ